MDLYVFIQALPGQARGVMQALVERGAVARAALVTGEVDVVARVDDVSWEDLAGRVLEGVQSVEGISRSWSAPSVDIDWARMDLPPIPKPIRTPWREAGMAFVGITTEPAQTEAVIARVAPIDGVLAMTSLTGEPDLLVQVVGDDLEAIARTVIASIRAVPGVASTVTSLILDLQPPEVAEA